MITGVVDSRLEPRIPLFIDDTTGQTHRIEAVVDTGFTGFLSLPSALITSLGLTWLLKEQVMLADGSIQEFDAYSASVIWDSQSRTIRVYAVDSSFLVGMKLLVGNELRIRVVAGGLVLIDALP